jgi:hypothetical protein
MPVSLRMWKHKNPKWGLTKAWVEKYNRKTGSNLKTWIRWTPKSQEDFRRKGSFLTRFFTNPSWPMKDDKWRPTRLAKSATAWWEKAPSTKAEASKLAAKWRKLLDKAKEMKKKK